LEDGFAREEKRFCCPGCLAVHDLLAASGLGEFYRLGEKPGVRIGKPSELGQYTYLDEPAVRELLLDFTDGRSSRVTFHIPTIHCIACVWLLENLYRLHPGVGRSQVNFPKREVAITFTASKLKLSELVALLASIGYEPSLTLGGLEKNRPAPARQRLALQIGVAGFAFGNIMLLSLPLYLGLDSLNGPQFRLLAGYLALVLALPVLVYSAADYWKSAWLSFRQRVLTLDVPIALGLAALYGQSAWQIVGHHGEGYLDSLCGLIFFLLCGRAFQQKTHARLAFELDYKSFFPLSVTRKVPTAEERVAISQLQVGDHIIIRNGELIPADAKLVGGPAFIDYSFVTGESEPIEKKPGDYLYAGGQQVGAAIELETVKPVSQSYLTSLWNHEAFQKNRDAGLDSLTNRYSRRFTFLVVAIALGAAIFWALNGQAARGLTAFTSVLIVACPCALALAAPFTLGTAQRLLARLNVFVKNALVLERMAEVRAIVFDKTGTLTAAGVNAVRFAGSSGLTPAEERWVCSLARHSTHPHSVRIAESLSARHFPEPVWSYLETPGCGIEGRVQDHEVWLGSQKWLESRGAACSRRDNEAELAGSTVPVAIDGRYRGAFVLGSSLRPAAAQLLHQLGQRHELALLSGDNERERAQFREFFGRDARLNFNQTPLDKLGFIMRLQQAGKVVMMVGDGLNDAGALRQSDVGVAVVEKVGTFSPASDVILEAGKVARLADVLTLARRATRIVRIGFVVSGLYNVVGVSIAAAGVLSPLICAVLMPVSSLTVVLFACGATALAARRLKLLGGAAQP
jgi:Cu+-exporting ATPase